MSDLAKTLQTPSIVSLRDVLRGSDRQHLEHMSELPTWAQGGHMDI